MAMHGILECYESPTQWFGGVVCTNGAGSARTGKFATVSDADMQAIRADEQREAARLGQYSFIAQLNYASTAVKNVANTDFQKDLAQIIQRTRPEIIYTHNLADKHSTHVAVAVAVIKVLRQMPPTMHPKKLIGCEVWRDLDWMPDAQKIAMNVSARPELSARLNALFQSQISGGKRYDLAIEGRRRANATFFDSHSVDAAESLCFGMDMTPLIEDETLNPKTFTLHIIDRFKKEVSDEIEKYL